MSGGEWEAHEWELLSLLRAAAVAFHDFGRGHQPGPRSRDADRRVCFSQCQQMACAEARAALDGAKARIRPGPGR